MHGSKKSEKHPKGISADEWKSGIRWHHGKNKRINIKEEVEQIDELSKKPGGILDTYQQRGTFKGDKNRDAGRKLATKKLNPGKYGMEAPKVAATNEEAEQIDELSKGTMGRYILKGARNLTSHAIDIGAGGGEPRSMMRKVDNREKGIATAVSKLTKEEQDFVDSLNDETFEEVEITEARGRPRKAGAKDFTIHPRTKEKLMHNNPAHMKKIEVLQKNGILEKPKVEAGQHIMNQLSKAKTSMLGGSKINFTHGDSKEVSGTHAAKILTKYAGMKPNEKEDFQKFVGHSHENLMKHV
jgi:hypothetical protein